MNVYDDYVGPVPAELVVEQEERLHLNRLLVASHLAEALEVTLFRAQDRHPLVLPRRP